MIFQTIGAIIGVGKAVQSAIGGIFDEIGDGIKNVRSEVQVLLKDIKSQVEETVTILENKYQENLNITIDSLDGFTSSKLREIGKMMDDINSFIQDDINLIKDSAIEVLAEAKKELIQATKEVEQSIKKVIIVAGETASYVLDKAIYNILTLIGWIMLGIGLIVIISIFAKRGIPNGLGGVLMIIFIFLFLILFAALALIPKFRTWIMTYTGIGLKARLEEQENDPIIFQVKPRPIIIGKTNEAEIQGYALLIAGKQPKVTIGGKAVPIKASSKDTIVVVTTGLNLPSGSVEVQLKYSDKPNLDLRYIAAIYNEPITFPNLTITNFSLNPPIPKKGQAVIATITVKNTGQKDAGKFLTTWKPGVGNAEMNFELPGLKVNESKSFNLTYTYPQEGRFTSIVTVDRLNVVPESNETDNILSRVIEVKEDGEMIRALFFNYHTIDEDKNYGAAVGAVVQRNGEILSNRSTGRQFEYWEDNSWNGWHKLDMNKPIPWNKRQEIEVAIWHRHMSESFAWRFRVEIEVELTDGSRRRVLNEYDPEAFFNHKPGNDKWWSFDLRGDEKELVQTRFIKLNFR